MRPGKLAKRHKAGPLLQSYSDSGCPVAIVDDWTLEQLDAAVAYGAHPSAESPEAIQALHTEALEKVEAGFTKLVPWRELRRQIVAGRCLNTKISPIAAIPHKSRLFRMILDLSSKGQRGTSATTSVNELTDEAAAPNESMAELGQVLGRIIYTVAMEPTTAGPILFCKLDIKDGFWRMSVPEADELQFCYVLPQLPDEPSGEPMIVVPTALQMGWKSSPAFFCAATETGRDIAELLAVQPWLPPHPLEHHMMNPIRPSLLQPTPMPTPTTSDDFPDRFSRLLEVYCDDYVGLLQSTNPAVLRHHSRALLHAIHQIFPPPTATGHSGEEPISLKKLVIDGEGIWDTRKEILGWFFDGLHRTMELPPKKVDSLRDTIRSTLRSRHIEIKAFESFIGKCQHACLGVPGGKALITPLYKALHAALRSHQRSVRIHPHSAQACALTDLATMFQLIGRNPIHCRQLVPAHPAYIGHCDACKHGAGGIWLPATHSLHPIVWRHGFPPEIINRVSTGALTINDLEMAAILLQYLLLEQIVDLKHTHTATWCDNTSAVSWTVRMNSSRSTIGQQLTRALAIRMICNQASPLAALSIAGVDNELADLASRSFKRTGTKGNYDLSDSQFLTQFNSEFPLTQDNSWLMLRLNSSISSLVCTLLRGEAVPTGSWIRLKKSGCDIGLTGSTSPGTSIKWTPFSPTLRTQFALTSSQALPSTCVKGMQGEDIASALAQFRTRYAPSARPSNWTTGVTLPTSPPPTKSDGPGSETN